MAPEIPSLHPARRIHRPDARAELAAARADRSGEQAPSADTETEAVVADAAAVTTSEAAQAVHRRGRDAGRPTHDPAVGDPTSTASTGAVCGIGAVAVEAAIGFAARTPEVEFLVDGIPHKWRANGQLVRRNHQNKWVLTRDPSKPASPESAFRRDRKIRAREGRKNGRAGGQPGRGVVPIESTSPEDKLRVKLEIIARKQQRGVAKDGRAPTMLVTLPGVHALSLATRYMDGGRDRFLELVKYAALDNHPAAVAWWIVFADLTASERSMVSFDDVCIAAGVRPSDFMALIVKVAMEVGRDVGNLIAAMTHPLVIEAAAKSAQRIDGDQAEIGFKDRERLLQHHGLYPIPRGLSVNVNASASAQAAAAAKAEPSVPSFAATMTATEHMKVDTQRALAAGPVTAPLPSFIPPADASYVPAVLVTTVDEDEA